MMAHGNSLARQGVTVLFTVVFSIVNLFGVAYADYTPAEMNMLLGTPVLLDAATCQKRYGQDFCACIELEQGGYGCYYQEPAAGFYTLERCETIWGVGSCECLETDQCKLKNDTSSGIAVGCEGQIFIFPGLKDECQRAGIFTNGENCCSVPDAASESCSFTSLAKELGWDDAAIDMMLSVGGYFAKDALATWAAEYAVQEALTTGAFDTVSTQLSSLLGEQTISMVNGQLVSQTSTSITTLGAETAVEELAAIYLEAISIVGWAYTVYSLYNMYTELTACKPAESILRCKRAKNVCHEVGSRCVVEVFGHCLQRKEIFCCYDSVLARIVQEQGRAQLGRGWGSASSPECRGFYLDEFSQIDFSAIDMSEYGEDLARQVLSTEQIESKIQDSLEKWQD